MGKLNSAVAGNVPADLRTSAQITAGGNAIAALTLGGVLLDANGNPISLGGGSGTKTLAVFTPMTSQPPATNFATLDTRNSIALLDADSAAVESVTFVDIIPEGADLSSGITAYLHWTATTATTGSVRWRVEFEKAGTDIDSDSFDTATEATSAANGTSGIESIATVTCTAIDSLAAGNRYRVRISRVGTDATHDTMDGDAELIAVELRQVA